MPRSEDFQNVSQPDETATPRLPGESGNSLCFVKDLHIFAVTF
jgi:hypothetical protein